MIDIDKLRKEEFEKKVLKFIDDVELVYSTVDKMYMTNASVNYSKYKHAELCDTLGIMNAAQRNRLKVLALKYATVIDVQLPINMGIEGDL